MSSKKWWIPACALVVLAAVAVVSVKAQEKLSREEVRERQAELRELHRECLERLNDLDEQLADIEDEDEDEAPSAERTRLKNETLSFINAAKKSFGEVLAVKDPERMSQARTVLDAFEEKEMEWEWVTRPELAIAAELADMRREAAELEGRPLQKEIAELTELAKRRAALARKRLAVALEYRKIERQLDRDIDTFWKKFDILADKDDEDDD